MVEKFGMPHRFLTLTANETSNPRWEEIDDIEEIVKQIDALLTSKDCLVECASLFHTHIEKFMQQYVILGSKVLVFIKEYVIRYELQHYGFVHAHIILWIECGSWMCNK